MRIAEEIPFSHLIQHSRDTIARLESSQGRQLRLVRRDGEDLVLESAKRAEADAQAALTAARLISEMMRSDETAALVLGVLPAVFPWIRFLPDAGPRPAQDSRHHRLRYDLATRKVGAQELEQWQIEVTGGGRVWYVIDDGAHTVWVTLAGTGHPKTTD